jgi:hypothetical protein
VLRRRGGANLTRFDLASERIESFALSFAVVRVASCAGGTTSRFNVSTERSGCANASLALGCNGYRLQSARSLAPICNAMTFRNRYEPFDANMGIDDGEVAYSCDGVVPWTSRTPAH